MDRLAVHHRERVLNASPARHCGRPNRLSLREARGQGAEVINFDEEQPVLAIREMTNGIGVDRAVDAAGVDADQPDTGPAAKTVKASKNDSKKQVSEIAPKVNPMNGN